MVGRESKLESVFSWADEVEKEEAAAAAGSGQAEVQEKQKPNPFGSARPREHVLQERGIDWRQLDLHLQVQQPSPFRRHESQNEKLRKQSNPYPTSTTILNNENPVKFGGSPAAVSSQVIWTPQIQIQSPILFVPSLKYPPKYVAGFLYQPGVSTTLTALNSGYQHFKLEKENRFQEGRKFHNLKSESAMSGNIRRTTTELVQAKEAQEKGRNRYLGESVVYGNKPEADSATRKEKFIGRNSLGLPLVNQNIGPPEMQDKKRPVSRRQPRNIQDDLGRDGTAFQVSENKEMEDKRQKVTRKVQDVSVKQVNNGGRDNAHRKIKGNRASLEKTNKKKFEKKQITLN
ncbi:hypothetical protein REPUB_Repub17cG0119200 [Reevesia pubescens]